METLRKQGEAIVADDDPGIRNGLKATLESMGLDVFLAFSSLEAVTIASRMQATLVILAIKMPQLDGVRACARIRALPGYASTPIVMLTSNDTERVRAIASGAGATMFLTKPFGAATLMVALSELLTNDAPTFQVMHDKAVRATGHGVFTELGSSPPGYQGYLAPSSEEEQILETLFKPAGVIVADDDPLIRSVLKAKLEAIDQDVFLAHNGLEAVELASRVQASLVILDIKMPKLDGILACEKIRQLAGYAQTPIVILTFDDTEQAQRLTSRAGATMFLVKPFGSAALMLALSRYLPIDENKIQEIRSAAVRAAGGTVFAKMHS
jgi:DNA-binding response OmpR family regulator